MLNIQIQDSEIVWLQADKNEFQILKSTCKTVSQHIKGGFHARIGATRDEVEEIVRLITEAIFFLDGQQNQQLKTQVSVSLDQLRIIGQFLNEACNGIRIFYFENQIGTNRNELISFLALVSKVYRANR